MNAKIPRTREAEPADGSAERRTAAVPTLPALPSAACTGERHRIWEIDATFHCSVLGTCLTLGDLHQIARRGGYRLPPTASAYAVHTWFVKAMKTRNQLSKLVDSALERRHQVAARKLRRARTLQELLERWNETSESGNVAGAYWGAISHPLSSAELHWRLFGDVHMLSHLLGASRRLDLCRLHRLESSSAELEGKLAQLKHDYRAVLKERNALLDDRTQRQRAAEQLERRLSLAVTRIDGLGAATGVSSLEARVVELEAELRSQSKRAARAETDLAASRARLDEARAANASASENLLHLTAENQALEAELRASIPSHGQQGPEGDVDDLASVLEGRRVLCVGGRNSLVPHYRALVERRGGEFLHHDGGLEDSMDAVTRALGSVDAVLCPVDCVSHAATLKVKRACKHLSKRFIPLRSSGLSSFARAIQSLARDG